MNTRTVYSHCGVAFPNKATAKLAVFLSAMHLLWRYTPSGAGDFELPLRWVYVKLMKDGDRMPTPADRPIVLLTMSVLSNRMRTLKPDGSMGEWEWTEGAHPAWTEDLTIARAAWAEAFKKPAATTNEMAMLRKAHTSSTTLTT